MKKKLIFSCLGLFLLSNSVQAEALSKKELQKYLIEHNCQITREDSDKIIIGGDLESDVSQSYGTGAFGESARYGYLTIYLNSYESIVMNMEKQSDADGSPFLKLRFARDLQSLNYSTAQEFNMPKNNYWRINLGYPNKNRVLSCNNEEPKSLQPHEVSELYV